jgi:hypothetical protein
LSERPSRIGGGPGHDADAALPGWSRVPNVTNGIALAATVDSI